MTEQQGTAPGGAAPERRLITRRRLLIAATGTAAAAGVGWVTLRERFGDGTQAAPLPTQHTGHPTATPAPQPSTPPPSAAGLPSARWSDPATWGGSVPGRGDTAVVTQPVLLDVDAEVAGVRVEPGAALVFSPDETRSLRSSANLTVQGTLTMRPSSGAVVHRVDFVDVDEGAFIGGTSHDAPADDVGLWVLGPGVLDLQGTRKTAWTHLAADVEAGASTITVVDATGWQVGDELVVTPTLPTTTPDSWAAHDRRTVTAVDGTRIRLDSGLDHAHPAVTVRPGTTLPAEVLNITRNVVVAGQPGGRSHVQLLQTTTAQQIGFVGLQHLGPRQGDKEVVGRYGLHFHMAGTGSRGSVVEGAVVLDGAAHAFVPHLSDGITFRDCITHDTVGDAYWWDLGVEEGRDSVPSNDIVYERCVASFVHANPDTRFNLAGFMMGAGAGNVARGCVAVGVEGNAESSAGYHWPSHSRDDNTWVFEDNLAHNNRHSGVYYWQNGAPRTIVTRLTAYHNGQGIFAGSYSNLVSYRDCTVYANENVGLVVSALPSKSGKRSAETITYEGMYIDQAGLSDYAVEVTKHLARGDGERVTVISGSTFMGGRVAQVAFPEGGDNSQLYDFLDCTFQGNAFWLANGMPRQTALRVQGGSAGDMVVRPADQPGDPRPDWNATVTPA